MKRAIITPAILPPAALAELKDWLGITTPRDDALLGSLLRASLALCEDFTGIMPLQQICEDLLPAHPPAGNDWQQLSARPVQAITALQGIPVEGARFALPTTDYALDLDADGGGRVLVINPGAAGRITVRFTAGLVPDWASLPEPLRHGILRLAAHQHRMRETDGGEALPPAAVAALWRPWRRLRVA